MANSDLLGNLLLSLTQKADPEQTDDNTLIQKMVAPNDYVQLQDNTPVFTQSNPSSYVWGGLQTWSSLSNQAWSNLSNQTWNQINQFISPGWIWGAGQYK